MFIIEVIIHVDNSITTVESNIASDIKYDIHILIDV